MWNNIVKFTFLFLVIVLGLCQATGIQPEPTCVNNCQECRGACNSNSICVGNDSYVDSCSCMPERRLLTPCGGDAFALCRKACQQCPDPDHCTQADIIGCPPCKTIPPGGGINKCNILSKPKFIEVLFLGAMVRLICRYLH